MNTERLAESNSSTHPHTAERLTAPAPTPLHDALKVLALLVSQRRLLMWSVILSAVLSAGISWFFLPNWYAATVNALPPRRTGSVLDGLSGSISSTLKDFGLTKLSGGKVDGYSHLVILQSRRMQDTLIQLFQLAKLYDIDSTKQTDLRKELDEHLSIAQETEGNYTVTAWHTDPHEAARMANKVIELGNLFANEIFQAEARANRQLLERRFKTDEQNLFQARDSLLKFSKKYKLYSPLDQAKAAASALADLRVQRYKQELATEMYATTYGANDPATQAQRKLLANLQAQEERAFSQPGLAGEFAIGNVGSDVALEYMRLYTDVEVFTKIKTLLLPMMEQAVQDEQRMMPALYVLDPAVAPDKKDRPKRSLIVLGTTFGTFVLVALYIVLRERWLSLRERYRAIVAEQQVL
jgi:capsule polysaccharide export protein KpsE/RkpR